MPPGIEVVIPVVVEVLEAIVLTIVVVIECLVHEVVKFITTVEVTTTFTGAVRSTDALSLFLIIFTYFIFIRFFAAVTLSVTASNVLSSTIVGNVGVIIIFTAVSINPSMSL